MSQPTTMGGGQFRVFLAVSPSKACPSPMNHHEHVSTHGTKGKEQGEG